MTFLTKSTLVLLAALGTTAIALRAADVTENFEANCASCHGKDGKGETKAGRKAKVKDFTDKAYQAKFSDADAMKAMKEGMKDEAGKERMKSYTDKLNEEEMKALVAQIRSFAK